MAYLLNCDIKTKSYKVESCSAVPDIVAGSSNEKKSGQRGRKRRGSIISIEDYLGKTLLYSG